MMHVTPGRVKQFLRGLKAGSAVRKWIKLVQGRAQLWVLIIN
jgi:hypothetical protein